MYKFDPPLEIGKIVSRPNRFVMNVEKNGDAFVCHCPSTGRIGNISMDGAPCLLSKSSDKKRKTACTVEAISVDDAKSWIGINQNAANRYVEHFFKNGSLEGIVKNGDKILREQKVGSSKLDFKIENTYVEVKTPLKFLAIAERRNNPPTPKDCETSHERFIRHLVELQTRLKENENAILALCFLYDAPMFKPPKPTEKNKIIQDTVISSAKSGVKMWQINMSVDPCGVNLLKYFEITQLFLYQVSF
jgi:sugar fermentation stimulation protein A